MQEMMFNVYSMMSRIRSCLMECQQGDPEEARSRFSTLAAAIIDRSIFSGQPVTAVSMGASPLWRLFELVGEFMAALAAFTGSEANQTSQASQAHLTTAASQVESGEPPVMALDTQDDSSSTPVMAQRMRWMTRAHNQSWLNASGHVRGPWTSTGL